MTVNEIENLREMPQDKGTSAWENAQYIVLGLTIIGQVIIGGIFLAGQGAWLIANIIAVVRDFALRRPTADKVKDAAMLAITIGIIAAYFMGVY